MRIAKIAVPEKINIPGAIARQVLDFGDVSGYSKMAGEYFSMAAGVDIAPLLKGLEDDLCQSPHWGYMISGALTVTYLDGSKEEVHGEDLFYWPPGHTIAVSQDVEMVLFSPQQEHCLVVDHLKKQLMP